MRFLPVGAHAVLVELDDLAQTLALLASLQAQPLAAVQSLVPAARTILLTWQPHACSLDTLAQHIAQRDIHAHIQRSSTLVDIPVHYNGEDLADVAHYLGITPEEVVRRHTGSVYTVAFTGFAPGFAYLSGGDPSLHVPRRSTPRTRIPAGSVGLAGQFSGVYPQASPGGWQIIGQTALAMWDLGRAVPALLQPGFQVRFVDVATISIAPHAVPERASGQNALKTSQPADSTAPAGVALEVLTTGVQTLFQDLGRAGQAGQGVSVSGALDTAALRAANRLVGNPPGSAALENACGGLRLRSQGDTVLAVTGAAGPLRLGTATGQTWPLARYTAFALADGDTLHLGPPRAGVRSYVAVRGGFCVQPVLGSCATDTLAHIGPPPVLAGHWLPVHTPQHGALVAPPAWPPDDLPLVPAELAQPTSPDPSTVVTLDVLLGPRQDWFTPAAQERLCSQLWQVTPQSNRIGLRLHGAQPLERSRSDELPSEATVWGAIQVPPSGQPVLFLADHPVTGGYPVIGCVAPHHLGRAGQIPVHAWVRFHLVLRSALPGAA